MQVMLPPSSSEISAGSALEKWDKGWKSTGRSLPCYHEDGAAARVLHGCGRTEVLWLLMTWSCPKVVLLEGQKGRK